MPRWTDRSRTYTGVDWTVQYGTLRPVLTAKGERTRGRILDATSSLVVERGVANTSLDDVLVAWAMNGEPLPLDHGYPVRLVVPGWVGIASIKWLGELRVTTSVIDSPWNTRWYRMHGADWDGANSSLGRMPVKSIVDVVDEPSVGRISVLRGRAWAGEASIRMVEVSTDGGETWDEASLTGPNEPSAWVEWEHPWIPDRPGAHVLVSRATDSLGRRQPDRAPDNDDGYLFWAVVHRPVVVAGAAARTRV